MAETTVPEIRSVGGGGGQGVKGGSSGRVGVEITRTITPEDHGLGMKVLHRKTIRVKLNRTIIITGKSSNRDEIFNNAWSDKNIV
jgi:hypothetical protein